MIYIVKLRDIEESESVLIGAWSSIETMEAELLRSEFIAVWDQESEVFSLNPSYFYDIQIVVQNGLEEEQVITHVIENCEYLEAKYSHEIYRLLGLSEIFTQLL